MQLFLNNDKVLLSKIVNRKQLNNQRGIIQSMKQMLSVVVHKEKSFYIAECMEVGTVSQGRTIEEAIENLKESTELYLEEFPIKKTSKPFVSIFEVTCNAKTSKAVRI